MAALTFGPLPPAASQEAARPARSEFVADRAPQANVPPPTVNAAKASDPLLCGVSPWTSWARHIWEAAEHVDRDIGRAGGIVQADNTVHPRVG